MKRGAIGLLGEWVIYAIFLIMFIIGMILLRIRSAEMIPSHIITKQVALLINSMQEDTEIILDNFVEGKKEKKLEIEKKENEIKVCIEKDCFSYHIFVDFEIEKKENVTIIRK